jgi:hypothetical protein
MLWATLFTSIQQIFGQEIPDVAVTIFRDEDSLTIYIPDSGGAVSLQGFRLEVVDSRNNRVSHGLEEYPSFRGLLPFNNIPTPICLRLERDGSRVVLPLNCNGSTLLTQRFTCQHRACVRATYHLPG